MRLRLKILNGDANYHSLFSHFGNTLTKGENYDVLVLTGGSDVNPNFYGQPVLKQTGQLNIKRDEEEREEVIKAFQQGKIVVGICRGAQFLNVMNNGSLIQDVSNHAGLNHYVWAKRKKGDEYVEVNSTHHQMMIPAPKMYELWAWAEARSDYYLAPENHKPVLINRNGTIAEPEAIWYPDTQSLCIQWHPEFSVPSTPFRNLFFEYFNAIR